MGKIIIKRGSENLDLDVFKDLIRITRAEHSQDLNSVDQINLTLESEHPFIFKVNDTIIHENRKFKLNQIPKVTKNSSNSFIYELIFESTQYDLIKKKMFNTDEGGFKNSLEFPLTGPIETHLQMLVTNANRENANDSPVWQLGIYPEGTDYKTLTYSNSNCLEALQNICSEDSGFGYEFQIIENNQTNVCTLNVLKIGEVVPYTFSHGMGKGLYRLERSLVSKNITTRLFVYGSRDNIPSNYRDFSDRLRMPETQGDYIEDAGLINAFGLFEDAIFKDDIKPTFKGIVSVIHPKTATGQSQIQVDNMDFDLKELKEDGKSTKYLIAGTPAKISVTKGSLTGYEFEIGDYDHSTKIFKINPFTDSRGLVFPGIEENSVFKFEEGDEFTLLDIVMPEVRITQAENKLLTEGLKDFQTASKDKVKYSLDIDPLFLESLGPESLNFFKIGDYVPITDSDLEINKTSRIISLKRDLLNLYRYTIEISDTHEASLVQSIVKEIKHVDTQVQEITIKNKETMLDGFRRMDILKNMTFDPDGYFDPDNIKPGSVETGMLSVGARSQILNLSKVIFTPNFNSDSSKIHISPGVLNHFTIDPSGIKSWTLVEYTQSNLDPSLSYYIYARVPRQGTVGTFRITTDKIKFDEELSYYNFLVAVLFEPLSGVRLIELMYGATFINGRTVKTGRISSVDGLTWMDLDTGEIRGIIEFSPGSPALDYVDGQIDQVTQLANAANQTAQEAQNSIALTNNSINDLNLFINGSFSDGIISAAEAKSIEKYLNSVDLDKQTFDALYNKLYSNSYLSGTAKTNLASSKTAFNTAVLNLINSINSAIADGMTTPAEKTDVDNKFSVYNNSVATLQTRIEEANKSIQDNINATATSAAQSAAAAQASANQAINSIGDLSTYVDGAFSDGLISVAEAKAIEKYINQLTTDKSDLDNKYAVVFADPFLSGTAKTNLSGAKNGYDSAHTNLLSSINSAISDGKTTVAEKADVDNKFSLYRSALALLSTRLQEAGQFIEKARVDSVQVGGRNLALNTGNKIDVSTPSNAYHLATYAFSSPLEIGKTYTISFKVKTFAGKTGQTWFRTNQDHPSSYDKTINFNTENIEQVKTHTEVFTATKKDANIVFYNFGYGSSSAQWLNNAFILYDLKLEKGNKATDWTPAPEDVNAEIIAAQNTANNALNQITDIGSDDKLTPSEKQQVVVEWNRIKAEFSQYSIQAATYGVLATPYTNAYNVLNNYITPLLTDLTTTSSIVGTTFRANFNTYYTQAVTIITAVEMARVDAVQVGGRNLLRNTDFKKHGLIGWGINGGNIANMNEGVYMGLSRPGDGIYFFPGGFEPGTDYTLSIWTKASYQEVTSARLGFEGQDLKGINIPTSATKVIKTSVTIRPTNDNPPIVLYNNVSGRNEFFLVYMKLEKGNRATDWTPAPEDVDAAIGTVATQSANALAQAQNALSTATALQQVTSFLSTTINGNVMATGTLAVGDVNGGNAFVSGVTDRPNGESIRIGAGKPYGDKYLSPFQVLDNGLVNFVNPTTGRKTFVLGFDQTQGKVVFDIFDDYGAKVASIGSRGIEFIGYLAESYTEWKLKKLSSSFIDDAALITEIRGALLATEISRARPITASNNWVFLKNELSGTTVVYKYDEGRNFESGTNAQYNGFYKTRNKFGPKLEDGVYVRYSYTNVLKGDLDLSIPQPVPYQDGVSYYPGNYEREFQVFTISSGRITLNKSVLVTGTINRWV